MTGKQNIALSYLRRAREESAWTDDGIMSDWTYYDVEVGVAYVHWRTAEALERAGHVEITYDPEGSQITLVGAALGVVGEQEKNDEPNA